MHAVCLFKTQGNPPLSSHFIRDTFPQPCTTLLPAMIMTPLARPSPVPPPYALAQNRGRICMRHPGYGDLPNNVLLSLPAVDCNVESSTSSQVFGLHHRTVLTAGAIIANNAFDRAYLAHDQAGVDPVTTPLDGMIEPGDYWLHMRDEEPPSPAVDASGTEGEDGAPAPAPADGSMPPPSRPRSSSSSTTHQTTQSPKHDTYPIVPSFGDWRFPHNRLPPEWKSPHNPPNEPAISLSAQQTRLQHTPQARDRCYLTDFRMGINKCHLVPGEKRDWFSMNGMAQYTASSAGDINDEANIAILRADLHQLFDQRRSTP